MPGGGICSGEAQRQVCLILVSLGTGGAHASGWSRDNREVWEVAEQKRGKDPSCTLGVTQEIRIRGHGLF